MGKAAKISEYYRQKRAKLREGEVVGGGYIVMRIDADSGRVIPASVPFEHGGYDSAYKSYLALTEAAPECKFTIYKNMGE